MCLGTLPFSSLESSQCLTWHVTDTQQTLTGWILSIDYLQVGATCETESDNFMHLPHLCPPQSPSEYSVGLIYLNRLFVLHYFHNV